MTQYTAIGKIAVVFACVVFSIYVFRSPSGAVNISNFGKRKRWAGGCVLLCAIAGFAITAALSFIFGALCSGVSGVMLLFELCCTSVGWITSPQGMLVCGWL